MASITLQISGLHAEAIATHLVIVLKNVVSGQKEGSIPEQKINLLTALDQVFQKLKTIGRNLDDESPQRLSLSLAEAEALIHAFTEPSFKNAALKDEYYQKHSYSAYFQQIYAHHLREVGANYILALAA